MSEWVKERERGDFNNRNKNYQLWWTALTIDSIENMILSYYVNSFFEKWGKWIAFNERKHSLRMVFGTTPLRIDGFASNKERMGNGWNACLLVHSFVRSYVYLILFFYIFGTAVATKN